MRTRRRIYTIILAALAMLLAACQPTPETQAVVNKIDSPLNELVLVKADPNEEWPTDDRVIWNETKTVNIDIEMYDEYTVSVSIDPNSAVSDY